jgi:hypothetical protein
VVPAEAEVEKQRVRNESNNQESRANHQINSKY